MTAKLSKKDEELLDLWRSRQLNAAERQEVIEKLEARIRRLKLVVPRKGHSRASYFLAMRQAILEHKTSKGP